LFRGYRVGDLQQFKSIGANGRHRSLSWVSSLFALAQRFGDQRVGQNESGLGHVVDAQQNVVAVVTADTGTFALGALQFATKPFAPVDRRLHLDLSDMAGIAVEVVSPHERSIDAGRGNFQPIRAFDRIGNVEYRRQRARYRFTVLNVHRPVGTLGHDLHGATGKAGYAHPHQTKAETREHGFSQYGDARRSPGLGYEPRLLGKACVFHVGRYAFHSSQSRLASGNKKERVPGGPLSNRSDHPTVMRYPLTDSANIAFCRSVARADHAGAGKLKALNKGAK